MLFDINRKWKKSIDMIIDKWIIVIGRNMKKSYIGMFKIQMYSNIITYF